MKSLCLLLSTIICMGNLHAQTNPDSGLVAYYPFNGNANDESGNDNNGSVSGAILTSDRFGNDSSAFEFDGTSSHISIPNSPSLQSPSTELTQVAWLNIYSWSLVGTSFGPVLMKSNSGGNAFQYRLSVGTGGINTAINNWDNAVTNFDTLNFNEWYMVASTLKNDTVKSYLNGEYIGDGTLSGPMIQDDRPLEIGSDVPGALEIFHGVIDDVRIYNRALSESEVMALMVIDNPTNIEIIHGNPKKFTLGQNYPNPFNPTTTISYELAKEEPIILKVFDIIGRELETLVNERQNAGHYKVVFNAYAFPSGVYVYRLQTSVSQQSRKMLLLH